MARYPGKLERAFNDSMDYERKLKKEIDELRSQLQDKAIRVREQDKMIDFLAKQVPDFSNWQHARAWAEKEIGNCTINSQD